jgi:putative ABC transport system substrate-binding protein
LAASHTRAFLLYQNHSPSHTEIKLLAIRFGFKLPMILSVANATDRGALIAYTYDYDAMFRLPVAYIDRILKGESPSSLPVQAPTKFELSINLKTAGELGLKVPPTLLAIADKLVE